MANQRIYYVPPRLAGVLHAWSGLTQEDGASWLLDHAAGMGFNAIWLSPFHETTEVRKTVHGKVETGSYYAIRNHFRVNPEFGTGDPERDREHLAHFCARAQEKGMRVYADLVFNHIAADHPLVGEEDRAIRDILASSHGRVEHLRSAKGKLIGLSWEEGGAEKTLHFKFRRGDDLSLLVGGPPEDPWSDVAQINYSSPEARRYFVTGDENHKGLFKQVIDWHMDLGFSGFRCDAAYMIPPETWEEIVSHARARQPDCLFLAETLGQRPDKVERLARAVTAGPDGKKRPAFDMGMLGIYWWNYADAWMPQDEHPRVQSMSRFGGAGAPDNHDTAGTLAGNLRRIFNDAADADAVIAAVSVRDYAVSALACSSVFMQMGYEFCNEKQNGVFRGQVLARDWRTLQRRASRKPALDLRDSIRAVNRMKASLNVDNCRVEFRECRPVADNKLVKIHCVYADADSGKTAAEVVLFVNRKPEKGPVDLPAEEVAAVTAAGLSAPGGAAGHSISDVAVFHTPPGPAPRRHPALPRP